MKAKHSAGFRLYHRPAHARPSRYPGRAIGVAGGVRIDVMVAGRMQPRHAEFGGGRFHGWQQRWLVVDQVAQGDAERGAMGA